MSSTESAFDRLFQQLIELDVIKIDTEPLDARIERRLKKFWESSPCPRCGNQHIVTWENTDRIWYRDCNFKPAYTYGTPFHEKHLTCGEILLAFTLYADTLLSINQIAPLLDRAYKTVHTMIREVEVRFSAASPRFGSISTRSSMDNASRRIWQGLFGLQWSRAATEQPFSRRLVAHWPVTLAGASR